MTESETPALFQFAAGYLNEDWPDLFENEWAALAAFINEQPDDRERLVPEIRWVLEVHSTEAATMDYMGRLGCDYAADWDGGTYRGWLEEVARRVSNALDRTD